MNEEGIEIEEKNEQNSKNSKHVKSSLKQPLIYILGYAIIAFITPLILKFAVFENPAYSLLSNEGWAGFLGSYIGGVLGGLGTLLAMYLTLKNTIKIQEDNKKDTDAQIRTNNYNHQKEYQRDKAERELERKKDEENQQREVRRAFADDIAVLIGRYIADISNYHYASVFSKLDVESQNIAYGRMKDKERELTQSYREMEKTDDFSEKEVLRLSAKQERLKIEYQDAVQHYQEMKKIRDDNSKRGNRLAASEALFTLESKLKGIQSAEEMMKFIHEFHGKSSTNQDSENGQQVGEWLDVSTNHIMDLYADFRDQYIG